VSASLFEGARSIGASVHRGGVYLCIEGPQFSTKGESRLYRQWGVSVIGMTNMPEAKLAREAELCYATIALATDYDCWHDTEEPVTVEAILATLRHNVALAKQLLRVSVGPVAGGKTCGCQRALQDAVVTPPDQIPMSLRRKLRLLLERTMPTTRRGR
jgi:5'-methylthioadenosine phosphorylase